jgi:hypothetical protein
LSHKEKENTKYRAIISDMEQEYEQQIVQLEDHLKSISGETITQLKINLDDRRNEIKSLNENNI